MKEQIEILYKALKDAEDHNEETFENVFRTIVECFENGGTLFVCGNGGSHSDAQHFVGELLGKFKNSDRRPLPVVSLTAEGPTMTAISNDFGYEHVFARQFEGMSRSSDDVLLCLSTSGDSPNVVNAAHEAFHQFKTVISFIGDKPLAKLIKLSDYVISTPGITRTDRVQEVHMFFLHNLAELLDEAFND